MVVGDFLILFVSEFMLYGAISSFLNCKKFKNDKSAKLNENEKFYLKKGQGMGIPAMILGIIIGLGQIFINGADPFYLIECHGRGRCVEAHILSWYILGCSVFICGFVLFFYGRKKIEEVQAREKTG